MHQLFFFLIENKGGVKMSNQQITEPALIWKERIQQWKASSKTIAEWCRENNFVYSQCIYWKTRFLGPENKKKSHLPLEGFFELKDENPSDSEIIIEADGIRIHLSTNFDPSTLLRCLKLLSEKAC